MFVFCLSQIQRRPYCYTHSNQTLYNITNKIYLNPGPFLAPFYVLKPSSKTECLSTKSCTASWGGPIFPEGIPKIFWPIRAGSDFSRAYPQNFFCIFGPKAIFLSVCPSLFDFSNVCAYPVFSSRVPICFQFFCVPQVPVFSGYLQNFFAYF